MMSTPTRKIRMSVRPGWACRLSGEVTAPVVYAHSGNPEDYDSAAEAGHRRQEARSCWFAIRTPIVIADSKPSPRKSEGAAAILIYSDPAEDGYQKGKVFPDGPWGPEATFSTARSPMTSWFPAILSPRDGPRSPGAKRIPVDEAVFAAENHGIAAFLADAKPLLENMGGPVAPEGWQGGLPIKYHLGGEQAVCI